MTREELAALGARRAAASAQREQLTIVRAQRSREIEERWDEHRALRAAINRTCRDWERLMVGADRTPAENGYVEPSPAVNGDGGHSGADRVLALLRHRGAAQLQASEGAGASAF